MSDDDRVHLAALGICGVMVLHKIRDMMMAINARAKLMQQETKTMMILQIMEQLMLRIQSGMNCCC